MPPERGISDLPVAPTIESIVVQLNMIKATIDAFAGELARMNSGLNKYSDTSSEVRDSLNDLIRISSEVSGNTGKTLDDIVKKVNDSTNMFINNKTEISKEVITKLGLDEKMNDIQKKLDIFTASTKTIEGASGILTDSASKLSLTINQLNISLSKLSNSLSSLGIPGNFAEEAAKIIDYMISRKKGPTITFGELALKFDPRVVKAVLMAAMKANYVEWR